MQKEMDIEYDSRIREYINYVEAGSSSQMSNRNSQMSMNIKQTKNNKNQSKENVESKQFVIKDENKLGGMVNFVSPQRSPYISPRGS